MKSSKLSPSELEVQGVSCFRAVNGLEQLEIFIFHIILYNLYIVPSHADRPDPVPPSGHDACLCMHVSHH